MIRLRKPLERVVARGHPWVYREAVSGPVPAPGTVVTLADRRGRFLARGIAEGGALAARLWTTRDEPVDQGLMARRLRQAADLRARVVPPETDAYRLVHGEGDRLPGVVVDVYGDHAVLQLDGRGVPQWRDTLVPPLRQVLGDLGVHGLHQRLGPRGQRALHTLAGPAPPSAMRVREHGMTLRVDLARGQKTGLFLDHRDARRRVRHLARGLRVLNLYGYTGGFSVAAGLGGAVEVTTVDQAAPALALAEQTWEDNGLAADTHHIVVADVPAHLATLRQRGVSFDLVVADPPSFAPRQDAVPAALASYRSLHRTCLDLLAPGGLYLAASCSSHVDRVTFDDTLRDGAHAARRTVQVLWRGGAGADHPSLLAFPEGDYLKITLQRILD